MADVLSPDEVRQRRERKRTENNNTIDNSIDKSAENYASCVKIEYESMGRFSTPAVLYFKDFSVDDISDIVMCQSENLIETLVPILNNMKFGEESKDFDVSAMTTEDFIETLLALKIRFNSTKHRHPYMCDCQYSLPEAEQKLQEGEIDLRNIGYRSMAEVEDEYKNQTKHDLDALSEDEWIEYRNNFATIEGVADASTVTKEMVIDKIKIQEPFTIFSGDNKITLRLSRIADVIKAQKALDKEFAPQMKKIQNRVEHGVPGEVLKAKKQEEFETLQKQKAKKLISYIKAYSLLTLNDKELSDKEKVEIITNRDIFPRHITQDLDSFLDQLKHGVFHEQEFTCPLCGKVNKESLQYEFSVTELLPINSKSERDNRQHTRLNIRFGA